MNLDQVYDELYGAIDENLRSDTTLAGRVGTLETKMTAAEGDISDLEDLIPEVPGRQLKLVNLGTEYTQELKEDIYTGSFEKAIVGGYLTINNHVYIFAHPDYFLGTGSPATTEHHMVVVPAAALGTGKMNLTDTTAGGYKGSDMYAGHYDTTDPDHPVFVPGALTAVSTIIKTDFDNANVLEHYELLTTAVTDGAASNWTYTNSGVELMNETMVYGHPVCGSSPFRETGVNKTQLKLFAERPDLITTGSHYWLRDVSDATRFARVGDSGYADTNTAARTFGIRPYFCLKGTAPTP